MKEGIIGYVFQIEILCSEEKNISKKKVANNMPENNFFFFNDLSCRS